MDMNAALDVVAGIIFLYLILSIFCTSIGEIIAGVLRLRAQHLFDEIGRIIDDENVRKAFWQTGLVRSLSRVNGAAPHTEVSGKTSPSYIGSLIFARALLQSIEAQKPDPAVAAPAGTGLLDKIPENSILKGTLTSLAGGARTIAADFEEAVAVWFDSVMERTTGVYRRRMQLISFLVALVLVVSLNADTLAVARSLWLDDTLRAEVVAAARNKLATPATGADGLDALQVQTRSLMVFPLGWSGWPTGIDILWKAFGLLLTALAVSLGAPFWFDTLVRVSNFRMAGGKPEPAREPSGGATDAPPRSPGGSRN